MTTAYLAEQVITGDGKTYSPGLVVVHNSGLIKYAGPPTKNTVWTSERRELEGTLIPGFVNAHTHIELSWMKGMIPRGLGLDGFIREVVRIRENTPDLRIRRKAMDRAQDEMIRNGTIAAGDVSNGLTSLPFKKNPEIEWYNFIEVYGSDPSLASRFYRRSMSIYEAFAETGNASLVPHSTYSVSRKLFEKILSPKKPEIISLHHQESPDENEYFIHGQGKVVERLKDLGIDLPEWIPTGERPLASLLPMMKGLKRLLLVHNTYANQDDFTALSQYEFPVSWVLCPEANLFIEKKLPDIDGLRGHSAEIAIGTDSLASSRSLSILKQLMIIQRHYPAIPLSELIQWASWNGAKALGFENSLGRLVAGTRPGLLLLENLEGDIITKKTRLNRIA